MKLITKKSISLLAFLGLISSAQIILNTNKSVALNSDEMLVKTENQIKPTSEIIRQQLVSQLVIPVGTLVTFHIRQGYTTYTYCGIVTYWNGASYDIRVGNARFNSVSERDVYVGWKC